MSAQPGDPRCTVIVLAGPSGSGKSRLTRATGATQLRLDDLYRADTDPQLPMAGGRIDWDDVRSWDADAATTALDELLRTGRTVAPVYSIQQNRAVGSHLVDLCGSRVVVAEGIFAPDLLTICRQRGVEVTPVWLDRFRHANFSRRLRRDLAQHRKPPALLLRRGLQLWRQEDAKRSRALELGFRPLGMRQALALVRRLQRA